MTGAAYSPRLRTGVVLCGCGTAGGYQAGVLKALVEAGVRVDLMAAHGAGSLNALCAAVDGGPRVWDAAGPWASPRLSRAYRWRRALRIAAWGLALAFGLMLSPLLVLVLAAAAYGAAVLTSLASLTTLSEQLLGLYGRAIEGLFAPPVLPTLVPRAVVLALVLVGAVLLVAGWVAARQERSRRRFKGAFWWRLVGAPLDATEPGGAAVEALWGLVRGASDASNAASGELGRRYADLLTENLGQPGFSEVLVAVHDLDARRDLIAGVLGPALRARFLAARATAGPREAEALDLTGPLHGVLGDVLAGAMRLPVASAPALATFPVESYWRGETHRLCDRPELPVRLVDELARLGVEQVVFVSPASPPAIPHGMRVQSADLRARVGELVRSLETAALDDAMAAACLRFRAVFVVRPGHNPVSPFAFGGVYDESSDRQRTMAELMDQGYRDAYSGFIEPVVAGGAQDDDREVRQA